MKLYLSYLLIFLMVVNPAMAESPMIWDGDFAQSLAPNGFEHTSLRQIRDCGAVDPSAGAGIAAPEGSICQYDAGTTGSLFIKAASLDTSWVNVLTASTGWSLLGNAGTTAGANFLGTTDAVDLVLKTNNAEQLRISSDGTYVTNLGEGVVQSTNDGEISSAPLNASQVVNVPSGTITSTDVQGAIDELEAGKQPSGNYITEVTGDVTAIGPGVATGTVLSVGGKTSSEIATSVNDTQAATAVNTPSTIMKRDSSGGVAAEYYEADPGTLTTPGFFTATGSGNAGMYWDGANGLSFGYNGARVISLISAGINLLARTSITAGSQANPSLYWGADSTTGFYRIGSNNNGYSVSGTKLLDIKSASIDVTGTLTATSFVGPLTGNASSATTLSQDLPLTQIAQIGTNTILGNNTGGTADVTALSATQVTAMLNNFVGDSGSGGTKGLVPAPAAGDTSAGKFLSSDGTWAVPSGGGGGGSSSSVVVSVGNGLGSTNGFVRRFTTTNLSTGTAITYADSSTLGASFTINENGTYAISYCDSGNAAKNFGIAVNPTSPNSSIFSQGYANGYRGGITTGGNGFYGCVSWTGNLVINDVVRAMTGDTSGLNSDNNTIFTITKVN